MLKHGEAGGEGRSVEYWTWIRLRSRCNPNGRSKDAARYSARGIAVCDRWNSFENFLADMGRRPGPGYSIDRIDNDGPYSPGNCRWATALEQASNRRRNLKIRVDGETVTASELARRVGVNRSSIARRSRRGVTGSDLLHVGRKLKLTDFEVLEIRKLRAAGSRLTDLALQYGISISMVSAIALGKTRTNESSDCPSD